MQKEIWKDIQGYEGKYQVSSCGRVKSLPRKTKNQYGKEEIIIKQRTDKDGYKRINLYKNGKRKTYLVHYLVAETFLENTNNYSEINHIDECKQNNFVENLEFCTHEYNINYGTRNKRQSKSRIGKYTGKNSPHARKVQCINTGEIFKTVGDAAKWSKSDTSNIIKQIKGKRKTAGKHPVTKEPLQWKYYSK